MSDPFHLDVMRQELSALLEDLLPSWPMEDDLEYVREYLDHGEYGEALDNLIAVGLRNGVGFDSRQVRRAEAIAEAMGMQNSAAVTELRDKTRRADGHAVA